VTADPYELAKRIEEKILLWRSEHLRDPDALELHPSDEEILRRAFKPADPRMLTHLYGIRIELSPRVPRGGRIKQPTTKEEDHVHHP